MPILYGYIDNDQLGKLYIAHNYTFVKIYTKNADEILVAGTTLSGDAPLQAASVLGIISQFEDIGKKSFIAGQ